MRREFKWDREPLRCDEGSLRAGLGFAADGLRGLLMPPSDDGASSTGSSGGGGGRAYSGMAGRLAMGTFTGPPLPSRIGTRRCSPSMVIFFLWDCGRGEEGQRSRRRLAEGWLGVIGVGEAVGEGAVQVHSMAAAAVVVVDGGDSFL